MVKALWQCLECLFTENLQPLMPEFDVWESQRQILPLALVQNVYQTLR